MPWSRYVEGYVQSMMAAGRREATVRLHRHYVSVIATFGRHPRDVSRSDLERWLSNPQWMPETRKSARNVAIMFYRWALAHQIVDRSPAADLPPVRVPRALARPAPEAVFQDAMVRADARMRTMLMLARYAGLRAGEIAAVHSDHIDGDLLYVEGKGGRERVVPVVNAQLAAHITVARGWVFPSPHGGHLCATYVSQSMATHLPDGWTAHTLRHAFATRVYEGSRDLLALGALLGHASTETTRRYVATPMDTLRLAVASAA